MVAVIKADNLHKQLDKQMDKQMGMADNEKSVGVDKRVQALDET